MNSIYQREGITKLWVGNGATIIRIAPYAAIQFMTYEKAKQVRNECGDSRWSICSQKASTNHSYSSLSLKDRMLQAIFPCCI